MKGYPNWKDTPGASSPGPVIAAGLIAVFIALGILCAPRGCYWNGSHFGSVPGLDEGEYVKQTVWHRDGSATVTIASPHGERSFTSRPVNGIYHAAWGHPDDQ